MASTGSGVLSLDLFLAMDLLWCNHNILLSTKHTVEAVPPEPQSPTSRRSPPPPPPTTTTTTTTKNNNTRTRASSMELIHEETQNEDYGLERRSTSLDIGITTNHDHHHQLPIGTRCEFLRSTERLCDPLYEQSQEKIILNTKSRCSTSSPNSITGRRCSYTRSSSYTGRMMRSYKSMSELESEELQGFKDLGFIFDDRSKTCPRMLSMIPGLQRQLVEDYNQDEDFGGNKTDDTLTSTNQIMMIKTSQNIRRPDIVVSRPYLSDAWLINRSDYDPLLNVRIPSVVTDDRTDMKKHLRFWARTVASVIQQES